MIVEEERDKKWIDYLSNQISNMIDSTARCCIRDGPSGFFSCFEFGLRQDFDQQRENVCVDDSLQ